MNKKLFSIIITGSVILSLVITTALLRTINANASAKWLKSPQAPGRLVAVGKHKLYVTIKGKGSPVVIIESGLGSTSCEWWHIQNQLAKKTTVISYDRAGYGWSEPGPSPRSSVQIIAELKSLLRQLHINGPSVLVGHSIGGLYMQHFARLYPNEIKGMVLIDPFSDYYTSIKKRVHPAIYNNFINEKVRFGFARFLAHNGLLRALNAKPYKHAPLNIRSIVMEHFSQENTYKTLFNEYGDGLKISINEMRKAPLLQTPIIIINPSISAYRTELMRYELPYEEILKIEQVNQEITAKIIASAKTHTVLYAKHAVKEIHFQEPELIIETISSLLAR